MSETAMAQARAEMGRLSVDLAEGLAMALVSPFYLLGWLAGSTVRAVLWMVAAIVAGYKSGRSID